MSTSTSIFSSRLGYVLAFGAVVLGLAVMGLQMWRLYGKIDAFPRFSVPGQSDVELAAGEYILYAEPLPGSILTNISATCGALDATETKVALATPTGRTEYGLGGHHGVSIFAASIATSGKTRFQCESDDTFQIAIGTGLGLGIVASVLSAFAGFGVAVFLFFKTFLRRKRDQQAVSA